MRKEIEIKIVDRQKELIFAIQEMPAAQLEKWLIRLFLALSKDKETKEEDLLQALSEGNFLEVFSRVDFQSIEALTDELLSCVQRRVDNGLMQISPQTIDNHIEDVRTIFKLKMEVIKLNLDFLLDTGDLNSGKEQENQKIPYFTIKAPK